MTGRPVKEISMFPKGNSKRGEAGIHEEVHGSLSQVNNTEPTSVKLIYKIHKTHNKLLEITLKKEKVTKVN